MKNLLEEQSSGVTLRVYGGGAEETEGAQVSMAREGGYNLDAMPHTLPLDVAAVMNFRTSAQAQMYLEFIGKTAHAGQLPVRVRPTDKYESMSQCNPIKEGELK